MPRSSFSLNPLLRVSRPVSACSRCRAAKVKCDGKLPACTACERAGRQNECSSANDQFARGKERSYVAALELRVEKLERRLQYAKSRKASVGHHDPDASSNAQVDRRDSLASIRAAIHRKAARTRENSDLNALVSDFGFLSVNATTRDFEPSATNMTFARLVLAAATNDPIPESTGSTLPSRQAAQALVQYYMINIYAFFPCFTETTLLTTLDDVYHQDDRIVKDSDYWILYMVLAISSTAQSQRLHDENYNNGVGFVSTALEFASRALTPGHVAQIQSLLLLTQYSMLDPAHFDSWHLIGFTARAVIDLGLHQDPPLSSVADKASLDMRRKIFYCAYALDRSISMVHARSFSFTDDTVSVAFPSKPAVERDLSAPGPLSGSRSVDSALLLFQLRRAQSYWYQVLYQSEPTPLPNPESFIWQMCLDMREWGESLPSPLPIGLKRMFEQELRYSYVYCIAPSARAPHITDYSRTLIFQYSLAYLDAMHDVSHKALDSAFYTYHDALKVYFMANQFLAVLRDAEDMLLLGTPVPIPVVQPGSAAPPPIPRQPMMPGTDAMDNLERASLCLEQVPQTLAKFGERWDDALMLGESFKRVSEDTNLRLQSRTRSRDAASIQQTYQQGQYAAQGQHQVLYPSNSHPAGTVSQTSVPQGQHPGEMQWVGVDISQMMRGPGPQR